jgi:hypothetical protein
MLRASIDFHPSSPSNVNGPGRITKQKHSLMLMFIYAIRAVEECQRRSSKTISGLHVRLGWFTVAASTVGKPFAPHDIAGKATSSNSKLAAKANAFLEPHNSSSGCVQQKS